MLFPDGSNGDGYLPTADPGEQLVSPDHHLKKQIWTEGDDNLYLIDGPVSRSGLADGTRSGSDPEDDNASGSGPGTGLGCGVVSVVSVLFYLSAL